MRSDIETLLHLILLPNIRLERAGYAGRSA
jgi:hypothetical protein